jgi:Family of unknown function (DUF6011)
MKRTAVPEEFKSQEGITEPQMKFLSALLDERDLRQSPKIIVATDEEYAAAINALKAQAVNLTKRDASRWIEHLLTFPQLPRERAVQRGGAASTIPSEDDMPTGRYAIENEDGELRFYRFWRGTQNPNYVKLYVEHGPDDSEVPFKSALAIIAKIAEAGPWECAQRYGAEIGACSRCGLRLTNRISRLLKIGPICGGYWHEEEEWKGLINEARATIRAAGLDPSGNVEDDDNFDYGQELS